MKKPKYRSRMEARIVPPLLALGARYEPIRLGFAAKPRFYIPDVILANGIVLEIKGWFTPADRAKMLLVKAAYPDLDLRMVLASPRQTLSKTSKTTQAQWCERNGIPWADDRIPFGWAELPPNSKSLAVISRAPKRRVA